MQNAAEEAKNLNGGGSDILIAVHGFQKKGG
jgi:hypothetical protein